MAHSERAREARGVGKQRYFRAGASDSPGPFCCAVSYVHTHLSRACVHKRDPKNRSLVVALDMLDVLVAR